MNSQFLRLSYVTQVPNLSRVDDCLFNNCLDTIFICACLQYFPSNLVSSISQNINKTNLNRTVSEDAVNAGHSAPYSTTLTFGILWVSGPNAQLYSLPEGSLANVQKNIFFFTMFISVFRSVCFKSFIRSQ